MERMVAILAWLPGLALAGPPSLVYSPDPVEVVYGPVPYDGPPVSEDVVFYAPLYTVGVGPGVWSITEGPTAPNAQWWGADPAGSLGYSWAGTVAGTLEDVMSPVCANGACWTSKRFDGTDYIDASSEWGDPEAQDVAVCSVFYNPATALTGVIASKRTAGTSDGWALWINAGTSCSFTIDSGATTITETQSVNIGTWNLCCGFRDYDGNVGVYAQGTIATPTANTTTSVDVAEVVSVGSQYATHSNPMLGYIAWIGVWKGTGTAPVTEAAFDTLHARVFGLHPIIGPSDVAITRATTGCSALADASGYYHCFGSGLARTGPDGVESQGTVTNYWTNSLDASAWTDWQTPGVATDTTAGPWAVYAGGSEADTLTDDDAAQREGKTSPNVVAAGVGNYIFSCWLQAGTLTDYSLVFLTDGTGSDTSTGTDLTSSFVRKSKVVTIGGTPTYIYSRLQVGDQNADTGTIIVDGCQLEKTGAIGSFCPANGTAATCNGDRMTVATTRWPVDAGRVEFDYVPMDAGISTYRYFVSTYNTTTGGWNIWINNSTNNNQLMYSTLNIGGGALSTNGSDNLSWTPGLGYHIEVEWTAGGYVNAWRTPDGGARTKIMARTGATPAPGIYTTSDLGQYLGAYYWARGQMSNVEVSR